jgi:hypothetical protein
MGWRLNNWLPWPLKPGGRGIGQRARGGGEGAGG